MKAFRKRQILVDVCIYYTRAAFQFSRCVHVALWRKMLKSPIARLPAVLLDFINRPSGEGLYLWSIFEANQIWRGPNWFQFKTIMKKWPFKITSAFLSCLQFGAWKFVHLCFLNLAHSLTHKRRLRQAGGVSTLRGFCWTPYEKTALCFS